MPTATSPRSNFVTVVAWIFIALSGFASFIGVVQNLMLHFVMPMDEMRQQMSVQAAEHMPPAALFMFGHFELIFAAFLVVCLGALAASVGLLKRRNWARVAFIGLMLLGVVWNLGGLAIQQAFMAQMPIPSNAPPEFHAHIQTMMRIMRVVSAIFALGMSALFVWIAWRLKSPSVVAEFVDAGRGERRG